MEAVRFAPQEGPQTMFLSTTADIAIYGGAAGGGKSYALLLEPLRHKENHLFSGVIFRRNTTQVRNPGGLWDESEKIYRATGAWGRQARLEWEWKSGASMKFSHLEFERTVYDWQGSQMAYIGFDELTHFTEKQFWYMLSRNRSDSGIPGYVRATCNPDVDSWVRKLIDWWIGEDGYPIKERAGIVRYFIRVDEKLAWADTPEELKERYGEQQLPKSLTFIPSNVHDNKILMETDPSYLANLQSQSRVERLRLQAGNWNVRNASGMYFQRHWFQIIDALPHGQARCIRYWDKAATKPSGANPNPDWTRGCKMYLYPDGKIVIAHMASLRDTPAEVEHLVKATASQDGYEVQIGIEQDPGSAGVADKDNYVRLLGGYYVTVNKPTKNKVTRALPLSAQAEQKNVFLLRGDWNDDFLDEAERFPPEETRGEKKKDDQDSGHDDQIDAASGAYNQLCTSPSILDVL